MFRKLFNLVVGSVVEVFLYWIGITTLILFGVAGLTLLLYDLSQQINS
jgi:hypothetical protein